MRKILLMTFALLASTMFVASCGDDDDEEIIKNPEEVLKNVTVSVQESGNTLVLSVVYPNVSNMTITAVFDNNGICTKAEAKTVYATDALADLAWEDVEEADNIKRNGRTFTYDMTDAYQGRTKAEVKIAFDTLAEYYKKGASGYQS